MAKRAKKRNPLRLAYGEIGLPRLLAVAVAGIVGASLAAALAVSGISRTQSPERALRFMPTEGVALASRADELLLANPERPPELVRSMALAALRNQPVNPKALRVLGYYAGAKGDKKAEAYIRMAEQQSRREILAQLWLIEDSVGKGHLDEALFHYDIALRTKLGIYPTLFPILLAGLDDPAIRRALVPYMRTDNAWVRAFLSYANANSANLPVLVDLVLDSGGLSNTEISRDQTLELLQRLANAKLYADARRLYLRMPGATASQLVDAAFDRSVSRGQFGPIGWQPRTDSDSGGSFVAGDGETVSLSLFANAATTAPVATKLLYLPPGRYDFAAALSNMELGDGGFLRWQLRCPTKDDQPIWALNSTDRNVKSQVLLPPGCDVQLLDIVASGGSGQNGIEATVSKVSIRPTAVVPR